MRLSQYLRPEEKLKKIQNALEIRKSIKSLEFRRAPFSLRSFFLPVGILWPWIGVRCKSLVLYKPPDALNFVFEAKEKI